MKRAALGPSDPAYHEAYWRPLVRPLSRVFRVNGADLDALKARLAMAGRSEERELQKFYEEKVVGVLLGFTFTGVLLWLVDDNLGYLMAMISAVAGLYLPSRRLDSQATERKEEISASLPSAVDLLMTSVDAGLSIEQAIARVGKELEQAWPQLAKELSITGSECDAGVSLAESLRRLARRVELDDLSALCGVISQAQELGAPIVRTLAEYTDNTRKLRMSMLEEKAGALATKLTMPLAVFLLPSSLVFMLGPAFIQLMEILKDG
jgi:tight adherence protein C